MKPHYRWIHQQQAWLLVRWWGAKPNLPNWAPPRPHIGERFTS